MVLRCSCGTRFYVQSMRQKPRHIGTPWLLLEFDFAKAMRDISPLMLKEEKHEGFCDN